MKLAITLPSKEAFFDKKAKSYTTRAWSGSKKLVHQLSTGNQNKTKFRLPGQLH
jgi:hypothetical protein